VTPIEAIGNVSRGKKKEESRQEQRQAGVAEVDSAMGNGVDLPGDGHRLSFSSKDGHNTRKLVAAEIARAKCLNAAAAVWWGIGCHASDTSVN